MRIAYIDLGINQWEDYSLNPKRYGGGAVVARYAKELLNGGSGLYAGYTFDIFASKDCFDNLTDKDNDTACIPLEDWRLASMKAGAVIAAHVPNASSYDVFLHHHDCQALNMQGLKAPLVHWALMGDDRANWGADYSLLYRHNERAQQGKSLYVVLGKPIPPLQPVVKQDYVFQCTRHDPHTNSIEVAQWCVANKVRGLFAGPIDPAYPLMSHIDNVSTFYLGAISEDDKLKYTREARLVPLLFQWDCPFNQTAIEALACGTPLVVNPRGFLGELVKDQLNGIYYQGDMTKAWEQAGNLKPEVCHGSVSKYSERNMIGSFRAALDVALRDWKACSP